MRTSPMLRLLIMGVILVALNVPLTMMCGVVERARGATRRGRARGQRQLGRAQTIGGPVLSVPYRYSWTDGAGRSRARRLLSLSARDARDRRRGRTGRAQALALHRHRLHGEVKLRGRFAPPRMPTSGRRRTSSSGIDASVSLGVSDPRGIARAIDLTWNGEPQRFVPGSSRIGLFQSRSRRRRRPA